MITLSNEAILSNWEFCELGALITSYLHNCIPTVVGRDDVRNIIVHGITELRGDCIFLRGQQVVTASHKAKQFAVRLALDEESAHGGGQISTAMESNDSIIRLFCGVE